MYTKHTVCRACSYGKNLLPNGTKSGATTEKLIPVADFGLRPLANDFRREHEEHAGFAPLQVLFCPRCHLAQLSVNVNPAILYRDYPYVTSNTLTMQQHFKTVLNQIGTQFGALPDRVLEIGSNDGRFLKYCLDHNVPEVVGVEPDKHLAEEARTIGVATTNTFWPEYDDNRKYDVIVARHVFAHCDNWQSFVARASELMHDKSLLWIEAPYVQALLDQCQVDTIYHEHLSYVNLLAIEYLLKDTDLCLHDVHHYGLHGGCVALVIGKRNQGKRYTIPNENLTVERWRTCYYTANQLITALNVEVMEKLEQGKNVCGYGASAKSSFWVQSCGWTRKEMKFICDDTKQKWFRTSPGTDIPIVDEGALLRELPDYAVCFAWNFMPEVLKRQELYISKGGKFIVPVPEVKIIP